MFDVDPNSGRFVRVHFSLEYIVPADRQDMIDAAIDAVHDDLLALCKYENWSDAVVIDDAKDATESDVPDFIHELCDGHDDWCPV